MESDLDNHMATELTLGLPGTPPPPSPPRVNKRANEGAPDEEESAAPASKAQVVGWPPVTSYRMNRFNRARKAAATEDKSGIYVKVAMDGAPYLRKVDLGVCKGYKELMQALDAMFRCFSKGGAGGEDEAAYAIAYEDKDGDWMLVGDVPWEMFTSSCKRLRIMKGDEARGLRSRP